MAAATRLRDLRSTFTITPNAGRSFYLAELLPSPVATEADSSGGFGVLSVPPGSYTLRFTSVDVDYGAIELEVAAGELVGLVVLPTPNGEVLRP